MTNLPVPQPANAMPGQVLTSAFWNANVTNGVDFLVGVPIAQLYQASTGTSVLGSTYTAVVFDTAAIDNYGGWSSGAGSKYVAQVPGYYLCMGSVSWGSDTFSSGKYVATTLRKNGSTFVTGSQGSYLATGSAAYPVNVQAGTSLIYMNTGDYIELVAYQNNTSSSSSMPTNAGSGANVTSMQLIWIHA